MQAFEIATRKTGPVATVWAESRDHATHVARRVLRLAHGNAALYIHQINGRGNRHAIQTTPGEAVYVHASATAVPQLPPRGFAVNDGQLWIDGRETCLRLAQRRPGGTVELFEVYATQSAGLAAQGREPEPQVNYYHLPRRRYTLHTWPALPRTGSYMDFERDVRALLAELEA